MTFEHSKPFCLEHARAAAPVGTRSGADAAILYFHDAKIIGYYVGPLNEPFSAEWTNGGIYVSGRRHAAALDLVMLPLTMLDGKPVYPYDKLVSADGREVLVMPSTEGFTGMSWPKESQYPKTKMGAAELLNAFNECPLNGPLNIVDSLEHVANAAIERAFKDRDVVRPGEAWGADPWGMVSAAALTKALCAAAEAYLKGAAKGDAA